MTFGTHQYAITSLKDIGDWMAINSEAIHYSRPIPPYKEGQIALTKRDENVYAIYLAEKEIFPSKIILPEIKLPANFSIKLLGFDGAIKWIAKDNRIEIDVPESVIKSPLCKYAFVFKIANH
jgi:alpha-L-fucosidase